MKKNTKAKRHNGYERIEANKAMHSAAIDAFSEFMDIVNSCSDDGYGLASPEVSADVLTGLTIQRFRNHNEGLPREKQWPIPTELIPHQVALLVMAHHHVRLLPWVEDLERPFKEELLFAYQTKGPKKGLYTLGVSSLIKEFEPWMGDEKVSQVEEWLKKEAEKGVLCVRDELVAVNNGILNWRTEVLMPFSPEYIFLVKGPSSYVPAVR